jgi:hypothetical protein
LHVVGNSLLAGRVYIGTTDSYFYRDAANRIATPDQFYVQSSSANTYLYSTNTYLGAGSGDNIHLRANKFDWTSGGGGIINTSGNVAIGHTSPTASSKLDIKGIAYFGDWGVWSQSLYRIAIGWYSGVDPIVQPMKDGYGYCGTFAKSFWWMYSYGETVWSDRDKKRNIVPLDNDLYAYVMNDIDKIKPSFYKFKIETDELEKGNGNKYRPYMHLGVITDESPDYIQDPTFAGIEPYAIATLSLVGVKYNRKEIQEIKDVLEIGKSITASDFGTSAMEGFEMWVDFSDEFSDKLTPDNLPVITVTANNLSATIIVTEKTPKGFKVKASRDISNLKFDWMAMAKVKTKASFLSRKDSSISIDLLQQLKVPESTKQTLIEYYKNLKPTKKAGM